MRLPRPLLLLSLGLAWSVTAVGAWWVGRQGWGASPVVAESGRSGTSVGVRPPLIVGGPGANLGRSGSEAAAVEAAVRGAGREGPVSTAADALRRAAESKNPLERFRHLMEALTHLRPEDGDQLRAYLEKLPPGGLSRMRELPLILNAWARVDGMAAVEYALINGQDRTGRYMVMSALQGWAAADPTAALAFAEDIRAEAGGPNNHVASVLAGWAQEDPGAVGRYLETLPEAERERYLFSVARAVIAQGQDTAWAWALGLSDPALKASAFSQVVRAFGEQRPEEIAARVAMFAGEDFAVSAIASAAGQLARDSTDKALAWVQSLPEGAARNRAEAILAREWASSDPAGAAEWLSNMGEGNDSAVAAFVGPVARVDPEAAVIWAGTISDEARRVRTLTRVGQTWFQQDPVAASAWLQTSGLPAENQQQVVNPPAERPRGQARGRRPPGGGGGGGTP